MVGKMTRRETLALLGLPLAGQQPPVDDTPVLRMDVDLVNVFFSVRDRRGTYMPALGAADVTVYEDGKAQKVKSFVKETGLPLTLGLLVDVSGSQERLIETERQASHRFFQQVLREKDMAFLISFGTDTDLLQDATGSVALLRKGLDKLRLSAAVGSITPGPVPTSRQRGTLLFDAVWLAARDMLREEVGRKAMVVITDGVDVGSKSKIGDAIEEAQRSDAIIYSILYEDRMVMTGYGPMMTGPGGEGDLKRMSEETGGRVFRVDRRNTLDDIYKQIQDEMRSQYALTYTPSNATKDGSFRRIEIRPSNKDLKVQARKGYYAPKG